ncbi:hypothetical protein, partial [Schleiferilactobacillus shenzhenensis]|uniref:hypothetical protein n=1 Tax=Schleiferilactobacillus shenzhenensis TaxID=1231337 RepID=UPI0018CA6F9C
MENNSIQLPASFTRDLSEAELANVSGAWSLFGVVAGTAATVGGVAGLLAPEPTGLTKVAGWSAITGGVATIGQ